MPSPAETRKALVGLTVLAKAELVKTWALVGDARSADQLRDFLMEVVPAIADKYGLAAGALAADWYDEVRDEAGAKGRFSAEPAQLPDPSRYEALVRWGVDPLYRPGPDGVMAQGRIAAGLAKIVTNLHGETLTTSSLRDPASQGWSRHANADGCEPCKTLAGRGYKYREATADFATHDHCNCVAVPEFGLVRDVKDYERTKRFATEEARIKNAKALSAHSA